MKNNRLMAYIGADEELYTSLLGELQARGIQLDWFQDPPPDIEDFVREWNRVLILDINISGRSGFEFLQTLKQHHAGIPIIIVCDPQNLCLTQIANARQDGAEGIVFKPLEQLDSLIELVEHAFRRLDNWQETLRLVSNQVEVDYI